MEVEREAQRGYVTIFLSYSCNVNNLSCMFKSLSKSRSLNSRLESHLHKNRYLYFLLSNSFLYLMRSLLFLAGEKSGIQGDYILITSLSEMLTQHPLCAQ